MNKIIIGILFFCLLFCNLFAQESVKFNRYYITQSGNNEIRDVVISDSLYILIGVEPDSITGVMGISRIKYDTLGNIIDYQIYSSNSRSLYHDNVNSTIKDLNSGFILTGGTYSASGKGFYLMKLNQYGDSVWFKVYDEDSLANLSYNLCHSFDTSYIVTGGQIVNNSEDMYVANVDTAGNIKWKTLVGGNQVNLDYGVSITRTWDSCYIAAGLTKSYTGYEKWFVVKLNRQGDVIWKQWYGENNTTDDGPCRVYELRDSTYFMYGRRGISNSYYTQGRIKKFDKNFIEQNNQFFGYPQSLGFIGAPVFKSDGYIYATGFTVIPEISNSRYVLYKLNSNLDSIWRRKYELLDPEIPANYNNPAFNAGFRDIDVCPDGGFIIAGYYYLNGEKRIWLIKTDSLGCDGTYNCDSLLNSFINELKPQESQIKIYPNPTNQNLNIEYNLLANKWIAIKVYNPLGQLVFTKNNLPNSGSLQIDVSNFKEGIYFIDFNNEVKQKFSVVH